MYKSNLSQFVIRRAKRLSPALKSYFELNGSTAQVSYKICIQLQCRILKLLRKIMFTNRQAHQWNIAFQSWFRQFVCNIPETSCVGTKPYRIEVLFTNKNGDFDEVSGTKRDCSATILRVDRKDQTKVELYLIDHFIV